MGSTVDLTARRALWKGVSSPKARDHMTPSMSQQVNSCVGCHREACGGQDQEDGKTLGKTEGTGIRKFETEASLF